MSRAIIAFPGMAPASFAAPVEVYEAREPAGVRAVLDAADRACAAGLHCVGFVAYEAAGAFDPRMAGREQADGLPLAWFAAFAGPDPHEPDAAVGFPAAESWSPAVTREQYDANIATIREAIADGEVYQVNYTFPMTGPAAAPITLWEHLRRAQPGAYSALLELPGLTIVSASPELFFHRAGSAITMRPMKGTAPRGRWLEEDDAMARALAASEKDRAENVMIVDLVRNDLGRVSETGSVRVDALCEVERFPTVLQMTSTVSSRLRAGTSTADVFAALFPCGSITGAPKIAAMQLIARLERVPRGVYCGAIGWMRPDGTSTFSVAIRTATVRDGVASYGVGGGITWDSIARAEYDEALLKAKVLEPAPGEAVELIETMRLEEGVYQRLDRHLARLRSSALYFGWDDPTEAAHAALREAIRAGTWRVRVLASPGAVRVDMQPPPTDTALVASMSPRPVHSRDRLLYHKTTWRWGTGPGLELFTNERGELTEFSYGNLVVDMDGERVTPPVDAGLLPGVFRAALLERGEITERTLMPEDLARASAVFLVNSLRGWVPVTVRTDRVSQ